MSKQDNNKIILRVEREYITDPIRAISILMWDSSRHASRPAVTFKKPVVIRNTVDDQGSDFSRNFHVTKVVEVHDVADTPMVAGHWETEEKETEEKESFVHLLCINVKGVARRRYDSRWEVDNLVKALIKETEK